MRSLRTRLALGVGAATFVLVSAASGLVIRQTWQRTTATEVDDLAADARNQDLAYSTRLEVNSSADLSMKAADRFAAAFRADGTLRAVGGAISKEQLLAHKDELGVTSVDSLSVVSSYVTVDGRDWLTVSVPCQVEEVCSSFVIGRLPTMLADHLPRWLAMAFGSVALLTGLAAWATRWIVGRSLRPVDRMRREVDEITATDVDRRVEVPRTGDEVEALGSSFNHTLDRLANSIAAQRRFASDAAHELRSPLAGVRATLELAHGKPRAADTAIVTSIQQIDRASALLDDLLVLARREGSPEPLATRLADVDDIVVSEIRALVVRRPTCVVDRSSVQPVQAYVQTEALIRVVRNLLDNAATHAKSQVRVRLAAQGEATWTLKVDDDGPGVPEVDRARVFDRFTRLDEARSRASGGTGLGLAIVRELVEAHGGTVAVTSSDLGGASFVVTVPTSR